MRSQHSNISTNKMGPYLFSPNPRPKRWQICTACCCPRARDQMPSPQYLILIQFGIFLATSILISSSLKGYLSHKNGPVDPNRISINSRPIRYQVPKIVFDKKLSIFYGFLLSWEIVRVTWRMLSMKMFDNTGMSPSRIMQHPVVTILPSDWLQSCKYEDLIGPLL